MKQRKGKLIVWPAYLDSDLTRSRGRKIPAGLAAPAVTVKMLKEAADLAGLDSEVQAEKRYPRDSTSNQGYLVVENPESHKKKRILLMLAKGVRRIVARQEAERLQAAKKGKKKARKP
ncbi:MAG: signal recognition particle protein Srp19 [Candidatus Thorarchaeota archaeon]|nr:signal recognition particle protein Srp19 [Candidatus Thorarchaeota archaeon]